MRDIKFRIWIKESNRFIYFNVFEILTNVKQEDKNNLQRYVLTTKDDIEVYEGDIISCDEHMGNGMKDYHRPVAVVMFDGCCWCYSLDKERNWKNPHQILRYAKNVKVIGNIFENPELLK